MRHDRQPATHPRRIVFLALPHVVLLDLIGPWEVFNTANALAGKRTRPYRLELISGDDAPAIRSFGDIELVSHGRVTKCRGPIDTLLLPASDPEQQHELPAKILPAIRRLAGQSRRVASVCGGAFLLAAAGLLDGKRVTTHWMVSAQLAASFPRIDVQPDAIFVKDGNVYTSAGVTTGIDLALALVEEDLGRAMALNCARHLVVFMRRPGGQSQFSATLESQHAERDALNELIAWATDNPAADLTVEALAGRVYMSPRNFARVFRREVGQTPAAFVERLRVEAARRRLEETPRSLETIARQAGFGSADSMRRSFRRVVNVSPGDYRERFRRT